MATTIMSMAARSSDLEDQMSGTNPQMEGHTIRPQRDGSIGQSPSYLPSWSLAWRLPPSCPNTRYYLGIHVTLTEETGVVPLPSHAWTVPLVEDMLCYARTGLTKAMVMGPSRAVLSMGDALWVRA